MPDNGNRSWFLVRRVLIAVAILAIYTTIFCNLTGLSQEICVLLAASVAGLFALGSINHPGFVFGICVVLWILLPTVNDSSNHSIFGSSCGMGWLAGSVAGWISRSLRKPQNPEIVYLDPPKP